jgi:23S rRNA (guanosine2251-2'-O)-methyltransferase
VKTEILYGIHPVYEALVAGRRKFDEIYLQNGKKTGRLSQLETLASARGIPVVSLGSGDFKSLVGAVGHQGAAARVDRYCPTSVSDILQTIKAKGDPAFLLMLDNILDPQNLGAIIRTALGVGIGGVIIPKDRCAGPTPAVCKASAGALEHIRLSRVTNLVQTINQCKNSGIWIVGLDKETGQSLYDCELIGAIAIVLGGEQKGIRPLVKKNCDFLVAIPQLGAIDSLNASVAAAVAMYEALRQRRKK